MRFKPEAPVRSGITLTTFYFFLIRTIYSIIRIHLRSQSKKVFGTKEAAVRYVNGKYKDLADADLSENYILYEIDSHDETTYISIRKVEIEY